MRIVAYVEYGLGTRYETGTITNAELEKELQATRSRSSVLSQEERGDRAKKLFDPAPKLSRAVQRLSKATPQFP